MRLSPVCFAAAALLLVSCNVLNLRRKQKLILDAPKDVELLVYRQVGKNGQRVMSPMGLIRGGEPIEIDAGHYLIANECSGFEFKQGLDKPTKIPLRRLSFVLHGEKGISPSETSASTAVEENVAVPLPVDTPTSGLESSQTSDSPPLEPAVDAAQAQIVSSSKNSSPVSAVHTMCIDPLDGQRNEWSNRRDFDLLPGTTEIRVGGRLIKFENHGETSEKYSVDLYPVTIVSNFTDIEARFYLTPEEKDQKSENSVIGLPANGSTWLMPGEYALEVNGTRRKLQIEKDALTEVSVGVLRVEMPKNFPMEDRLKAGGQPVFVYLDTGALLNLDTDYLVFPGNYTVSIEGSEVQDVFTVEGGEKTIVKTFAARIDSPVCSDSAKGCRNPPRITIHRDQKPYALMLVEPKLPFLLLEGTYEYGVEGMRGIKRNLQRKPDALAGEPLARVRIKWDVRPTQGRNRTDLVRIESRGTNVFGRSLDLLFHKPEEIYVPSGSYDLTYLVGDPLLERSKSRMSLSLEPGQTREVVVPLYLEKANKGDDNQNSGLSARGTLPLDNPTAGPSNSPAADGSAEAPAALPQSLTPLRR
jgi:hypothetical protein